MVCPGDSAQFGDASAAGFCVLCDIDCAGSQFRQVLYCIPADDDEPADGLDYVAHVAGRVAGGFKCLDPCQHFSLCLYPTKSLIGDQVVNLGN